MFVTHEDQINNV